MASSSSSSFNRYKQPQRPTLPQIHRQPPLPIPSRLTSIHNTNNNATNTTTNMSPTIQGTPSVHKRPAPHIVFCIDANVLLSGISNSTNTTTTADILDQFTTSVQQTILRILLYFQTYVDNRVLWSYQICFLPSYGSMSTAKMTKMEQHYLAVTPESIHDFTTQLQTFLSEYIQDLSNNSSQPLIQNLKALLRGSLTNFRWTTTWSTVNTNAVFSPAHKRPLKTGAPVNVRNHFYLISPFPNSLTELKNYAQGLDHPESLVPGKTWSSKLDNLLDDVQTAVLGKRLWEDYVCHNRISMSWIDSRGLFPSCETSSSSGKHIDQQRTTIHGHIHALLSAYGGHFVHLNQLASSYLFTPQFKSLRTRTVDTSVGQELANEPGKNSRLACKSRREEIVKNRWVVWEGVVSGVWNEELNVQVFGSERTRGMMLQNRNGKKPITSHTNEFQFSPDTTTWSIESFISLHKITSDMVDTTLPPYLVDVAKTSSPFPSLAKVLDRLHLALIIRVRCLGTSTSTTAKSVDDSDPFVIPTAPTGTTPPIEEERLCVWTTRDSVLRVLNREVTDSEVINGGTQGIDIWRQKVYRFDDPEVEEDNDIHEFDPRMLELWMDENMVMKSLSVSHCDLDDDAFWRKSLDRRPKLFSFKLARGRGVREDGDGGCGGDVEMGELDVGNVGQSDDMDDDEEEVEEDNTDPTTPEEFEYWFTNWYYTTLYERNQTMIEIVQTFVPKLLRCGEMVFDCEDWIGAMVEGVLEKYCFVELGDLEKKYRDLAGVKVSGGLLERYRSKRDENDVEGGEDKPQEREDSQEEEEEEQVDLFNEFTHFRNDTERRVLSELWKTFSGSDDISGWCNNGRVWETMMIILLGLSLPLPETSKIHHMLETLFDRLLIWFSLGSVSTKFLMERFGVTFDSDSNDGRMVVGAVQLEDPGRLFVEVMKFAVDTGIRGALMSGEDGKGLLEGLKRLERKVFVVDEDDEDLDLGGGRRKKGKKREKKEKGKEKKKKSKLMEHRETAVVEKKKKSTTTTTATTTKTKTRLLPKVNKRAVQVDKATKFLSSLRRGLQVISTHAGNEGSSMQQSNLQHLQKEQEQKNQTQRLVYTETLPESETESEMETDTEKNAKGEIVVPATVVNHVAKKQSIRYGLGVAKKLRGLANSNDDDVEVSGSQQSQSQNLTVFSPSRSFLKKRRLSDDGGIDSEEESDDHDDSSLSTSVNTTSALDKTPLKKRRMTHTGMVLGSGGSIASSHAKTPTSTSSVIARQQRFEQHARSPSRVSRLQVHTATKRKGRYKPGDGMVLFRKSGGRGGNDDDEDGEPIVLVPATVQPPTRLQNVVGLMGKSSDSDMGKENIGSDDDDDDDEVVAETPYVVKTKSVQHLKARDGNSNTSTTTSNNLGKKKIVARNVEDGGEGEKIPRMVLGLPPVEGDDNGDDDGLWNDLFGM